MIPKLQSAILILLMMLAAAAGPGQSRAANAARSDADIDRHIDMLLGTGRSYDPRQVSSALNSLKAASLRGVHVPWDLLVAEAIEPAGKVGAWPEVLHQALRYGGVDVQRRILEASRQWATAYRPEEADEHSRGGIHHVDFALLTARWAGTAPEAEALRGTQEYVALLEALADAPWLPVQWYHQLSRPIVEIEDVEARSRIAFNALLQHGARFGVLGNPLVDALPAEQLAAFRQRVAGASLDDWRNDAYPRMEASLLADRGDIQLPALLEPHIKQADVLLSSGDVSRMEEIRLERFVAYLEQLVAMARAQHPPEGLLDFINTHEPRQRLRSWAVQRALELGVPPNEIATAIRSYVEEVEAECRTMPKLEAQNLRDAAGVVALVRTAKEAGVLSSNDPLVAAYPKPPDQH